MEKNWLIRTTKLKILGPASRDKIIELVEKGSLVFEDEICVGNGFWFSIKEKEFLKKYLFDQEEQNFNPISEADVILSVPGAPSIIDCLNFPVKGNIVADAAKKILSEHFDRETSADVTQLTNLADFFKVATVHKKLKNEQPSPIALKLSERVDENETVVEEEEEQVIYPAPEDQEFPSITARADLAQDEILSTPSDGSGMILQLSPDKIRVEMKSNQKPLDGFEVDVGVLLANKKNGNHQNQEAQLLRQNLNPEEEEKEKDEDALYPPVDDLEFPTQENIEAVKRGEKLPLIAKEKVQEVLIDLKKNQPEEKLKPPEEVPKPPVTPVKTLNKKIKKSTPSSVAKKKQHKSQKVKGRNRRNSASSSSTSKLLMIAVTAVIALYCLFQFTDIIAQEVMPIPAGKKLLDYPPLINNEVVISTQMNPGGFRFEEFDGEIPLPDCQKINDFYYRFKFLLHPGIYEWMGKNSMLKLCPLAKNEVLALFEYRAKKIVSFEEFEKYLKSFKIDHLQVKKILEIYIIKKELALHEEYVDQFINIIKEFPQDKVTVFDKNLELLSQKYPDTVISSYFKMLTYLRVGNVYQVKQVMRDFVSTNFMQLVFKNPITTFLDQKKMKSYVDSIIGLMRILETDFGSKLEYQMMLNYFSLTYDTLEFYELKKRNNCDWTLSQIWEKSKSVNFGLKYFALWGSMLLSFDRSLAQDYVKQNMNVETLKKIDHKSLWFFSVFEVEDLKIGQMLAERIVDEVLLSQDAADVQSVIDFLQNQVVTKRLMRENNIYAKPRMDLEIEYYKTLLLQGRSVGYAVYQMLRRKQVRNEYLWWWVL